MMINFLRKPLALRLIHNELFALAVIKSSSKCNLTSLECSKIRYLHCSLQCDKLKLTCLWPGSNLKQLRYAHGQFLSDRRYPEEIEEEDMYIDFNTYNEAANCGKRVVMKKLQDLGYSSKEAEDVVSEFPAFSSVSEDNLEENVRFLQKHGVSQEVLKENPWVLIYKISVLESRFELLKEMNIDDPNVGVPLLRISLRQLRNMIRNWKKEPGNLNSLIQFLSKKLQCEPTKASRMIVDYSFLQCMSFGRLQFLVNLLVDNGVCPRDMQKDMWVLRHSPQLIQNRLERAKEAGVEPIKPWMMRCTEEVFLNTSRISIQKRELLENYGSVIEYLSYRLECSKDVIELLTRKNPPLLKINVAKLKEILDFLYEEGFTPEQVCLVPRILNHSLETIQSRLEELRSCGHNPVSLTVLCKSKKQYEEYINRRIGRDRRFFV